MRSHNSIDEYLMENKEFRLNFWSVTLSLVIAVTAFMQVTFVKTLFNQNTRLWTYLRVYILNLGAFCHFY